MALWKRATHGLHLVIAAAFLLGALVGVPLFIWRTVTQHPRPAPPTCAEITDSEYYARRRLITDAVEFARCVSGSPECLNEVTTDQLATGQRRVASLGRARAERCGTVATTSTP